jgi:N-acetylglucosaminyldiphosphoundecaprenol N-acetyl-beta-D-mannosaminyltransferase
VNSASTPRALIDVQGTAIDAGGFDAAVERILAWAHAGEARIVCCCNVHSVVTAQREPAFAAALAAADLATPDGAPVAWLMRRRGAAAQQRVSGPDLMQACLARAASEALPVALMGATTLTLERLRAELQHRWPALRLVASISPPFRTLSAAEDAALVDQLRASGARLVFVGLGCPKQELWMAAHRGQLDAVMLGVGAAFDFLAGTQKRAPPWMRRVGLEWLHRLGQSPLRLGWRYLNTNSAFVWRLFRR